VTAKIIKRDGQSYFSGFLKNVFTKACFFQSLFVFLSLQTEGRLLKYVRNKQKEKKIVKNKIGWFCTPTIDVHV